MEKSIIKSSFLSGFKYLVSTDALYIFLELTKLKPSSLIIFPRTANSLFSPVKVGSVLFS